MKEKSLSEQYNTMLVEYCYLPTNEMISGLLPLDPKKGWQSVIIMKEVSKS